MRNRYYRVYVRYLVEFYAIGKSTHLLNTFMWCPDFWIDEQPPRHDF